MKTERTLHIDTLRGLACILLVAYHVVGDNQLSGLQLSEGILREVSDTLRYIRMPLFTFLSGVVYAYRPYNGDWQPYLKGKSRRLLLPMLTVGTFFAFVRSKTSTSDQAVIDWSTIHLYPVAHFWFVEAIFIIFLVMMLLETINAFDRISKALAVLFIAIVGFLTQNHIELLSIGGATYLFPFFLTGMIWQRYKQLAIKSPWISITLISVGVALLIPLSDLTPTRETRREPLALITGLIICSGLLLSNFKLTWLAKVGVYSYSIYIFHVFFTATTRMALQKFGIYEKELIFLVGLFAGIAGPVAADLILTKSTIARKLFLGKP